MKKKTIYFCMLALGVIIISCQSRGREQRVQIEISLPETLTHSSKIQRLLNERQLFLRAMIRKGSEDVWSTLIPTDLTNEIVIPATVFAADNEETCSMMIQIGELLPDPSHSAILAGSRDAKCSDWLETYNEPVFILLSIVKPLVISGDRGVGVLSETEIAPAAILKFFDDLH